MMLQALIAYAERENLSNADFEPVKVTWQIEVSASGKFAGSVIDLRAASSNERTPLKLTRPYTRGDDVGHGRSHFLCDNLERALLYFQKPDLKKEEARKPQFEFFKRLLSEAASNCPNEATKLNALLKFLDQEVEISRARATLAEAKAKGNENVVFAVGGERILAQLEIGAFWRAKRAGAQTAGQPGQHRSGLRPQAICMVTGLPTNPVQTTRKVKGLWAGQGSGTNLIAFDKSAFTSYGLKKALNAALSPEADVKLAAALEQLIQKGLVLNPYGDRKKVQPVFLHWTKKPQSGTDVFDLLAKADESGIKNLLSAPKFGTPAAKVDGNEFYLMSLSANSTRIVVRDWLESTVPEVQENIQRWFEHLSVLNERDGGLKSAFGIFALLATLLPRRNNKVDFDKLPPQLPAQLLRSALSGGRLPSSLLAAAVVRQNLGGESKLNPARAALIKLYIVRNHSTDPEKQKAMSDQLKQLDPNSTDIAYLCGQLFAVIGRLQLVALGKVGTSLAERTYGGVATRPASTLGPIFNKVPAYLKKSNSRFPGAGTNKQKEIESLCARIDAVNKAEGRIGFPALLGLEEQGRFALGYYSQLAQYRSDRREIEIEEKAESLPAESDA